MSTDPKIQKDWDLLTKGLIGEPEVAEAAARLIPLIAQQLQALFKVQPNAQNYVLELLRRRFEEDISSGTYGRLMVSLTSYLGADPSYLLAWVAQKQSDQNEQQARLDAVSQLAPSEVTDFYRAIIASYGPELELSLARSDENPNNWSVISRDVYLDKLLGTHLIRLTIEKFNGEKFVIECSPDSMLALATGVVLTTRLIGSRDAFIVEGNPDVGESRIASFLEEVDALVELLRPKPKKKTKAPIEKDVSKPA